MLTVLMQVQGNTLEQMHRLMHPVEMDRSVLETPMSTQPHRLLVNQQRVQLSQTVQLILKVPSLVQSHVMYAQVQMIHKE